MTAPEDFVYVTWDGDFARHNPKLKCSRCSKDLCDLEEGDGFAILAAVVDEHECTEPPPMAA